MSEVHVREGESLENALKRFKRSCAKSGVLAEVRKREYYDSPSVKRRKKSEAARKNRSKKFYSAQKQRSDSERCFFVHRRRPRLHLARARVRAATDSAPATRSAAAHSDRVAPLVTTSSTSTSRFPASSAPGSAR